MKIKAINNKAEEILDKGGECSLSDIISLCGAITIIIERLEDAEKAMDHLKWCDWRGVDDCPSCPKYYFDYYKKWDKNEKT